MNTKTEVKHTPGPWEVVKHEHCEGQLWLSINQSADEQGMKVWIAEIKYRTDSEDIMEADGNRIVACVNACEGIENPADLRKQRDELLEAVKAVP